MPLPKPLLLLSNAAGPANDPNKRVAPAATIKTDLSRSPTLNILKD